MPWPGDRAAAAAALGRFNFAAAPALYWLSDGIEDGKQQGVARCLAALWRRQPSSRRSILPLGLLPVTRDASGFALTAIRAGAGAPLEVEAGAIGARGETLAATRLHFKRGETDAPAAISPCRWKCATPPRGWPSRAKTAPARCSCWTGARHSAAPASFRKPPAAKASRCCPTSIIWSARCRPMPKSPRAASAQLLDKHVSVLLLADVGKISGSDADKVKNFVSHGGVLIRFAGERMTDGADELVPVQLRVGGRYLGSAMAWSAPQHLAPFGRLESVQRPGNPRRSDGVAPDPGRARRPNCRTAPGRDWPTARR